MDEIYCEDCGAYFRNDCHCEPQPIVTDVDVATWRGMDGHFYEGDPKRASMAMHRDDCGCPGSVNFDPDRWY